MKDINVTISTRASILAAGVVLLIFAGTIGWAYKEMSSLRRDLYALRGDFYGDGKEYEAGEAEYTLVSQSVKELRVYDYSADYSCEKFDVCDPPIIKQKVRVLELKVKNNQDYLYSYYDGSLSGVDENGQLISAVNVHEDDNQNNWITGGKNSLELVPGGEATIFVYLPDRGQEVTKIVSSDQGQAVKLN